MSGSKVFLFLGKQLVGTVSESQEDQSLVFQYDQQWQKTGFALSPVLNFQRSFFTSDFLIFLENFLPEGQALDRLSILNSISKNNVFALALAIKNDLTGALSLSFSPTNVSSGISHKMGRRFLRRGTCTFSSSGTAIYGVSLIHNQLGLDALVDCFKN